MCQSLCYASANRTFMGTTATRSKYRRNNIAVVVCYAVQASRRFRGDEGVSKGRRGGLGTIPSSCPTYVRVVGKNASTLRRSGKGSGEAMRSRRRVLFWISTGEHDITAEGGIIDEYAWEILFVIFFFSCFEQFHRK